MTESAGPVPVRASGLHLRHAARLAWAVADVDLAVAPGERVLLTGASGSGKSTLLHAVGGLFGADAVDQLGLLTVGGRDPREVRDRVGLVAQDPDSQLVMSRAGDDVAFGLENAGVPPDQIWGRVQAACDLVGFGYPRQRPTHALSGGEKQRLVLAGALVRRPGLLLLDEPTSQLDPAGAGLVRDAVKRVTADRCTTMLLVDHDAAPWLYQVDRVVELLADGGLIEHPPGWTPQARSAGLARARATPGRAQLTTVDAAFGYRYGTGLSPVSTVLYGGGALAVTGPNGSGKSTLGLLLAGLRRPTGGSVTASAGLAAGVRHDRREPARWSSAELVARIGTVFQNPEHQFLTDSVQTELSLGPLRAGAGDIRARQRAEGLIERLGLSTLAGANPFTLSGGQQRRLSVATALSSTPEVLILDEPTFGQDAETWRELVTLLAEQRTAGCALCLLTHDRELVEVLADGELTLPVPP